MTSKNLRELAKQGDPKVISSIINHSLQKKGINVQVTKENDSLEIKLESDQVFNQQASLVEFIQTGIKKLGVESINTVKVYGVLTGNEIPVWEDEFFLDTSLKTNTPELEQELEVRDFPKTAVDKLDQELEAAYETETDEDYEEGEYDEEVEDDDYDEELSEDPNSQKKKIPLIATILLSILLVLVAVGAALHFSGIFSLPFLNNSRQPDANSNNVNSSTPNTSPDDSPDSTSATTDSTTSVSNPWYFAVKSAQSAAKKAQTAQTKSEWNAVASDWQKAVELMKKVPESNSNYQRAQKKVVEYQNNLDIAKQRADKAFN
ncbi:MAG: hypothetical protein MK289_01745 [Trichodesmium sp. ALOHA_ZT_67]|nr:hypothetical protein [Trichodesmium sp. ALOHA_ZT_67]